MDILKRTKSAWPSICNAAAEDKNRILSWLSFCAIRGLVYANGQTDTARNMRWFHIGVLCFAGSEYLLWTVGCFWPNTSPASPTFWCDMLLTLAILGLLPATRKAVEA